MQGHIELPQSTNHPFDLAKTLDGSQDFRWQSLGDGWHSGVLNGNLVHLRQNVDHPRIPCPYQPRHPPHLLLPPQRGHGRRLLHPVRPRPLYRHPRQRIPSPAPAPPTRPLGMHRRLPLLRQQQRAAYQEYSGRHRTEARETFGTEWRHSLHLPHPRSGAPSRPRIFAGHAPGPRPPHQDH